MIAYHGSNRNFKKLRIAKELVRTRSSLDNEGMGIYFSTDIEVARSYGKYIYVIEIADKGMCDFRIAHVCSEYVHRIIREVYARTGVRLGAYIGINEISGVWQRISWGGLAVTGVGRELSLLLDSNDRYYMLSESKRSAIERVLNAFDKNPPHAYMFRYNIENVGVIKDVSEDKVRIINKLNRY